MKTFCKFLLFITLITLYQCKEEKKTTIIKKKKLDTETSSVPEKKIVKAWDSLNRHNTEAFLTEFGKQNPETKVLIKTDFGNIKLRLYKDTPIHRANFIFLTKIKYFNTTVFYRVAKNFVIQGGNSDEMYTQKERNKYGNYLLKPEFRKNRRHKYGALAAAREWKRNPNKLSSPFEFYMVQKKSGAYHLDNEHTVFGEVISGFRTLEKISKVRVGVDEWPVDDVKMTIEILD
ncbi:peptidylprolyl isomerase [Polaribacter sp. Hel1_85]|uniref:peptidylprolyl isomerase n=1 Tax=Polaribacter sp. Hel1_85 TaxID=1250005 RepID=UPI00052D125F|nr:peptidylprolyl isomerase [Polaribacter sp. Hel1_85]KGL64001.1 peptidyl-prolyl cis-trans isomerase, cyclophilin-type [Polaribacter sp. Hel1_85]